MSSSTSGEFSTIMAAVNLAKLCIGAGVLALPYGSLRGGLIFAPLGIAIVAAWNGVACSMIVRCKRACQHMVYPAQISSTYSRIAYAAIGWLGVYITDFSIIFTLLGVCISFQITFATLMRDVPGNVLSHNVLTGISALLVYPMSCVPSIAFLSSLSIAGLVFLLLGVFEIFVFGTSLYGDEAWRDIQDAFGSGTIVVDVAPALHHHNLWPETLADLASYSGVAIFCFGLCSLAFPVEESMKHKHEFNKAVLWSLLFVWTVYTVVGDGGALLYSHDPSGVKGNILENLPKDSYYATFVRISMALVCLLTYPLTFIPPAQMIEFLVMLKLPNLCTRFAYQPIRDDNSNTNSSVLAIVEPSPWLRYGNRAVLILLCTLTAIYAPCFGLVVSLLGCFTVSILSFVLPPYLHLRLVTEPLLAIKKGPSSGNIGIESDIEPRIPQLYYGNEDFWDARANDFIPPEYQYFIDVFLTVFGVFLCVAATSVMVYQVVLGSGTNTMC